MTCRQCGRKPDVNGVQGHYIGCGKAKPQVSDLDLRNTGSGHERHRTRESECIKDGCTEPRTPHPRAKFCDKHKTSRKVT